MHTPLTNILMKIFGAGFYRMHSGMLVFLFGTVISYCFFINTLGSVPLWAFTEWNLVITLSVVSNPLILCIYFLVCLGYAVKSCQYIIGQLGLNSNEFLYYSTSSFSKVQQFKSWLLVQFNIMLPLWIYTLFAAIIGFVFGYHVFSVCIIIYLLLLNGFSALFYVRLLNRLTDVNKQTFIRRWTFRWSKPLFTLFTYHVFDQLKVTYFITKIVSWIFILGIFSLFAGLRTDLMIPGCVMLILVTSHSILIYNEYRFNETYLYFIHNFPYSRMQLFAGFSLNYIILMLPELLWFITTYTLVQSVSLILLGASIVLLIRSLMYWFGLDMKRFLFFVFILFNVFFLIILYHVIWVLIPVNLLISYLIFAKNYDNQSLKD